LTRGKQVTATQFPMLDKALVVETCWYMVDSFSLGNFRVWLLHLQSWM